MINIESEAKAISNKIPESVITKIFKLKLN